MSRDITQFLIGGIRVSPDATLEQINEQAANRMKRVGISPTPLHFRLYKRSVDARHRDDVRLACTVLAEGELSPKVLERLSSVPDVRLLEPTSLQISFGQRPMTARPLVSHVS